MQMTVKDLLANSSNPTKPLTLEDFQDLCYEFNINFYSYSWNYNNIVNSKIKIKELKSWLDGDVVVGIYAICLDDVPICIRIQQKRKIEPVFKFLSYELANQLYTEVVNLMPKKSVSKMISILDQNKKITIK